jgi:predicted dehydrogenase
MERTSETKPVTIVAIGAGNRTNKYLEYAIRNPDRLKLVGVAELNDIRRHAVASKFGLKPEECFTDYERFFENPVPADAILIGTPENMHFEPCMKAIEAGYNVLLEKPIAQSLPECCRIAEAARRKGVIVGVCHVLRYHPYFIKIKEIVDSGQLGEIISISHLAAVGLDRTTHGFVRGMWRREEITNPMLISKCCHDIDFLLWLTEARCRKLSSFGSLRWFRAENAPKGSTPRCIDCPLEKECPYSAVDLYYNRRDWISNFDVPEGARRGHTPTAAHGRLRSMRVPLRQRRGGPPDRIHGNGKRRHDLLLDGCLHPRRPARDTHTADSRRNRR